MARKAKKIKKNKLGKRRHQSDSFATGLRCHRQGQLAEAETYYHQAIATSPDNFECLHMLGVLAAQQDQYQQAIHFIERALQINSRHTDAWIHLGNAYTTINALPKAHWAFEKVISLAPDLAKAYKDHAEVYIKEQRFLQAELVLQKAIQLNPRYVEALNNMGCLLK